ncbi:hypothetical protein JNO42_06385 [Pseudomonas putida]|uniref:hypothetical protein n=1 Tax=Pseudomonas putida TaxID=303 RepID=UPI001EF8DB50|nr:hypothetical protein [Pseudomonas putida]ULL06643.1 hypothetical protein JNO42_06385 [Pseudomonas putida]
MSGQETLQELDRIVGTTNELLLSPEVKMMDVGGGVIRPTNAMVMTNLATLLGGAMPYASVALGLAGTANGTNFSVLSSAQDEYVNVYRNDAGAAVFVDSYPNSKAVAEIREDINTFDSTWSDAATEFAGEDEFVVAEFLDDGSLEMMGGRIANEQNGLGLYDLAGNPMAKFGANESDINDLVLERSNATGIEIVDELDFIYPDGDFSGADDSSSGASQGAFVALELNQQQMTDHMAVIDYGQSLGVGFGSAPVISTTQPYSNLMLASGTKVRAGDPGYNPTAYIPLIETLRDEDAETPVTGLCNGVTRRAVEDGELAANWVFVGCAPGRGGQSVEALGPNGIGDYQKLIQLVKDQAALSKSLNKSYSVWAYAWIQGEANYSTTGSGATATKSAYKYAQLELELFDGLSREVASITGQKFRPYLFTYQVGAHRRYSSDTMQIALAQWRASRQRPDVVVAVPVYIFPTLGDLLHLTNEGSWLLGEYFSRAMYETMIRRNGKWRPLEPVSVDWAADHIDIKFHVPSGQLVLDTALAASAPNFGFDIRESDTVATSIISSVSVTAFDTVRIALSRAAASDAVLSYARGRPGDPNASGPVSGARGNLRDTHGLYDTAESPLGNVFALHNPCVMFEYSRKTGF